MLTPEPRRKRTWELLSGLVLLLAVAGLGGAYFRHLSDNRELVRAIEGSDWKRAGLLLKRGADARLQDGSGATVLTLAAKTGDPDLLRAGLARGLDPNALDHYRMTPLMWAASHGSTEVVEALLAAGADLRARTPEGYPALTFATQNNQSLTLRDPVGMSTTTFYRPTQARRVREVYQFLRDRAAALDRSETAGP